MWHVFHCSYQTVAERVLHHALYRSFDCISHVVIQYDSFRTSDRHLINSLHLDLLDHLARSFILGAMATASTQRESAVEGAVPRLLDVIQGSFPSQSWIRQCLGSFVTEYILEPMSSLRTYLSSTTSGRMSWPADAAVFDGVDYASLLSWLQEHVVDEAFLAANVVQVVSGNRSLEDIDHYQYTARLQAGRTAWASRDANGDTEKWHLVFLKFGAESGLSTLHYTWAFVPALHALMLAFPEKTFIS